MSLTLEQQQLRAALQVAIQRHRPALLDRLSVSDLDALAKAAQELTREAAANNLVHNMFGGS